MLVDNYRHGSAITPSDSTAVKFRAIWVGGGGNIAVKFKDDAAAVTLEGVAAGTLLPINVVKVMLTNTTATKLVGLL